MGDLDNSSENLKLLSEDLKRLIIDKVVEQIIIDIDNGDITAIEELLMPLSLEHLIGFLSEKS